MKELQSLALDVRVLDKEGEEIDLKQELDDDEIGLGPMNDDMQDVALDEELGSFTIENADDFEDSSDDDDAAAAEAFAMEFAFGDDEE